MILLAVELLLLIVVLLQLLLILLILLLLLLLLVRHTRRPPRVLWVLLLNAHVLRHNKGSSRIERQRQQGCRL